MIAETTPSNADVITAATKETVERMLSRMKEDRDANAAERRGAIPADQLAAVTEAVPLLKDAARDAGKFFYAMLQTTALLRSALERYDFEAISASSDAKAHGDAMLMLYMARMELERWTEGHGGANGDVEVEVGSAAGQIEKAFGLAQAGRSAAA